MSVVTNEKPRFTLNKNTCSLCYLFKKWNLNQDWIEFSKPRNMVVVLISIPISTSQNLMPIKKKKKKKRYSMCAFGSYEPWGRFFFYPFDLFSRRFSDGELPRFIHDPWKYDVRLLIFEYKRHYWKLPQFLDLGIAFTFTQISISSSYLPMG